MGRKGKLRPAVAVCAVVVAAVTGCDPADGLGVSAVSVTTDQLATHALEQGHVTVQWLSCGASTGPGRAEADRLGRTDDRRRTTVKGTVTEQSDGTCSAGGSSPSWATGPSST